MKRREFLTDCGKVATGVAIGSIVLPLLQACTPTSLPLTPVPTPPPTGADGRIGVSVSDLSSSNPVKTVSGLYAPDGLPVLITRISSSDYRALSSFCPHAGCEVTATVQSGGMPCYCHGSVFGLDGTVQRGPAVAPLKQFDAIYDPSSNELRIKLA